MGLVGVEILENQDGPLEYYGDLGGRGNLGWREDGVLAKF